MNEPSCHAILKNAVTAVGGSLTLLIALIDRAFKGGL